MKRLVAVFGLGVLLAGGAFAAREYHFILARGQLLVERKAAPGFEDTFVNTGSWGAVDWLKNPRVSAIVAKRGLLDLFPKKDDAKDTARDVLDKTQKAMDEGFDKLREKVK